MKKIIALIALVMFTIGNISSLHAQDKKVEDRVLLKGGKMWVVKDGSTTELTQDLTLVDGKMVKTDGTVIQADGTVIKLNEGEYVTMSGKIEKSKMKNIKTVDSKTK